MKGQNSVEAESMVIVLFLCKKNICGVTILLLCTLSGDAFYLYQVLKKKSQKISKLLSGHYFQTEIFKRGIIP